MKKYFSIFNIQLVNSLAYPGELIGRSLMIIPFMWIFYQLWSVTFRSSGTDAINGMTLRDTMWYLMMAETIELGRPRVARTVAENVKDGSIAYLLNKPYDFMLYQFSTSMGETVFRTLTNALFGGAIVWLLVGAPPHISSWPMAIVAMVGAWILNFCMNALIGLAAFVAEDVAPFEWIYQKFAFMLGGLMIPSTLTPAGSRPSRVTCHFPPPCTRRPASSSHPTRVNSPRWLACNFFGSSCSSPPLRLPIAAACRS
jgi:ABC-2 type transport system permease protein